MDAGIKKLNANNCLKNPNLICKGRGMTNLVFSVLDLGEVTLRPISLKTNEQLLRCS